MATNEQMKKEFSFFGEVWTFFKRYYVVQEGDEYWKAVVDEARNITEKYHNDKLCCDLVVAVLSELERKSKKSDTEKEPARFRHDAHQ